MCDCSCKTYSLGAAWSKGYLQWLVLLFPSAQESLCKALDCWVSGTSTFFSKAAKSVLFLPHQVVFSCHRQPQCLNVWVKSECFGSLQNQWHTDAWSMLTDQCQVQSVLSSVFPGHPRGLSIREYPFHCKLVPLSSAH